MPLWRANILRQFTRFCGVGAIAAMIHYGLLVALVELFRISPVPATLTGYIAATVVSYLLNRRLTYASDRPHIEAFWRFVAVAAAGFILTGLSMNVLVGLWGPAYYLLSQMLTTGLVMFWHFTAHKLWTFHE